jgi:hypothetical protein
MNTNGEAVFNKFRPLRIETQWECYKLRLRLETVMTLYVCIVQCWYT